MSAVAVEITQVERRARVVDMAKTGRPYRSIGSELGVNASTVARDIAAWMAETKPSTEVTEELRQLQLAEINGLADKLHRRLDSDDYLLVTDRLVKLMDRKARLMGLDLERNVTVNVFTAEQMYEALFAGDAVEVEATEIDA